LGQGVPGSRPLNGFWQVSRRLQFAQAHRVALAQMQIVMLMRDGRAAIQEPVENFRPRRRHLMRPERLQIRIKLGRLVALGVLA
jgi:hypothetical protein